MSTATAYPIKYSEPRTIWTLSLQLFYTILAMIPFYYYLRNLVTIPAEGRYLLQFLPITIGILLFFIQVQLNSYYWREEKIFKQRDIFVSGLKSSILTLAMFYFIFFLIFGYMIGNSDAYESVLLSDVITRTMIQLLITLGTIVLTAILLQSIQDSTTSPRKFTDRFRRR